MKKKLLPLLLVLPFLASAQFSENFDAGTVKPVGWTVLNGGDTNGFIFGPGAPGSSLTQPNAAQINYSAAAHDDYLITPPITVTAGLNDRLYYFVKSQDPAYLEAYAVKISKTTPVAAEFTDVITPTANASGEWTYFSVDLSAYMGQTIYVGFHATSADKFRLLFDNVVNGTMPTVAPDCPLALTGPAAGATGVNYDTVNFTWTAPTTGGPVEHYELYLDTNPNPTTKKGITVDAKLAVSGLEGGTTYYWKVVSKNGAGDATGCLVSSFTTKANPFSPYCGPLTYSSGVEPMTGIDFGGMTNTSSPAVAGAVPHETFLDKVATVEQGGTYPITLQGNTAGNYTNRFIVFVDWNQDGDFLDAGETYFGTTALTIMGSTGVDGKTAVGNIVVPEGAMLGNTRMRVKKNFGTAAYPNPCASAGTLAAPALTGYGQAEDYMVTVKEPGLGVSNTTKGQMSVYPNPVKDLLNIESAYRKVTEVAFYSMDGKLVKTVKENVSSINVSILPKGVYIVKVKTSDAEKSFKVIKE